MSPYRFNRMVNLEKKDHRSQFFVQIFRSRHIQPTRMNSLTLKMLEAIERNVGNNLGNNKLLRNIKLILIWPRELLAVV